MLRSRKTPFSLSRVAALAAAFVLFSSLPVFAATYDVGAGQSYASLKSLFNSGVLAGGDSIVLHNNDSSLPPRNLDSATVSSLSISGAGGVMTISPNSSSPAPTSPHSGLGTASECIAVPTTDGRESPCRSPSQ